MMRASLIMSPALASLGLLGVPQFHARLPHHLPLPLRLASSGGERRRRAIIALPPSPRSTAFNTRGSIIYGLIFFAEAAGIRQVTAASPLFGDY